MDKLKSLCLSLSLYVFISAGELYIARDASSRESSATRNLCTVNTARRMNTEIDEARAPACGPGL